LSLARKLPDGLSDFQKCAILEDPVFRWMEAVRFVSRSRGRGRRRRLRVVTLVHLRGSKYWRSWPSGGDDTAGGRLPWDEWATEVFGNLYSEDLCRGDRLRGRINELLDQLGGSF
jgi:hypothetical protein